MEFPLDRQLAMIGCTPLGGIGGMLKRMIAQSGR